MNDNSFNRQRLYSDLSRIASGLAHDHDYKTHYDSCGRPIDLRQHRGGMDRGRVQRLQDAFEQSKGIAYERIKHIIGNLDIAMVWPILCNMCHDIGLYLGGSAVGGGFVGGSIGLFFGGVGAVPGAMAGTALGLQVGAILLSLIGLASVVEYMVDRIPSAAESYLAGVKEAWGPLPKNRGMSFGSASSGSAFFAANRFADGHVTLIMALLTGISLYLTRGKGDLSKLLAEVRQSARLGPKMADWVAQHADQLSRHPRLQGPMQSTGHIRGEAHPLQSEARTPTEKTPKPAASAPDAAAPPIKKQSPANKGIFGEAAGDQFMIKRDFEKLNNGGKPTQIGDNPNGWGLDGVWKNANPPPDYVITEMKFGESKLGQTRDGRQMSDDWLNGVNTGFDRLESAVGKRAADTIQDSIKIGNVEKWLLRIDENGIVSKQVLDAASAVIKGK
jgi:hypothetical protein